MDKEPPRERLSRFIREDLVPDWRPSKGQWLWVLRIFLALAVLLVILTLIGRPFDVTLWNWLKLLIVPVVLAIGGYLFTRSENRATQAAGERRAQDEALQAYLDGMSQLLTDKERPLHRSRPGDNLSTVARARTLTVLPRLDADRKGRVVQFLYESGLITKGHQIVTLNGADLREANLSRARLHRADLSRSNLFRADLSDAGLSETLLLGADLSEANLFKADLHRANLSSRTTFTKSYEITNLSRADLRKARLSEASLLGANLEGADLTEADLSKANLSRIPLFGTNLARANLSRADLSGAYLINADLTETNLRGANLHGVEGPNNERLEQRAQFLQGATMPNGQKYEDWLKDNAGHGENE